MRRHCLMFVIFVSLFIAATPTACAQERPRKNNDLVSTLRCAPLFGRGGIAFGESGYCEVNPAPWLGVGGIVGRSGVGNYASQGADADVHDLTAGLVLVARIPREVKRFRFGAFFQVMYSGSHIKATYPYSYQGENGNLVQATEVYRENDVDPIGVIGLNLEYYAPHGPPLLFRFGRNFGDGIAAHTALGTYIAAGPMGDPVTLVKAVVHFFHR